MNINKMETNVKITLTTYNKSKYITLLYINYTQDFFYYYLCVKKVFIMFIKIHPQLYVP